MASNIWVKVVGFSDKERHALNTLFRLSMVRETAYALWSPEVGVPPKVALIDAQSYAAKVELALPSFNANLKCIYVGSGANNAVHTFQRPVDWQALIGALDGLFSVPGAVDIDLDAADTAVQVAPLGVKTALLVGMARDERLYLRARLALAGLTDVDETETDIEAATKAAHKRYDVAIAGLDLSCAEPWVLVQTLQKLPMPVGSVIVATQALSWSVMEMAERLGCAGSLEIPFNPRQVIAALARV